MGIEVIPATLEDAIANGKIKEVKVAQYREGFGPISPTRIQAYGSWPEAFKCRRQQL